MSERLKIDASAIAADNDRLEAAHAADLDAVSGMLTRRGVDVERLLRDGAELEVALPSWCFGQGGTRFGRFPIEGEPRDLEDKLCDAATTHALTGVNPRVALHIPWDKPADPAALRQFAAELGVGFDAMNSNTFQDQPGQPLSYKFGSLSHTEPAVRAQAIEHNLECIAIGEQLGSTALSVWLADGGCFPGQQHLRRALDRTIDALRTIYAALPNKDWKLFTEHKPFEPAFYSTVVQDWGTSLMMAQALGEQASCLVDLGHHLPNTNIEMVVARLVAAERLGGFHFNDSKNADDDLSTGSIRPYQLFLIFNELVDAKTDPNVKNFNPAYMIDQSNNLKDPIEDLAQSSVEIHRAYLKALLVNRPRLSAAQQANDVVAAELELKNAYDFDVSPLMAEIRRRGGAAIDPIGAYRASDHRARLAASRDAGRALTASRGAY